MDPDALIDVVRSVVAAAVADWPDHTVVAVGVTGVGESGVLLDREGRPTAPIIAWYDQRGDVDAIAAALPDFTAVTGTRLDKVATIFKLPGLLRHGGGVRWLNIAEWVVRSLGGDEQAEMSLAGRTGLCDLHRAAWWSDALDYLGADRTLLPGDPVLGTAGAGRATFGPIAGAGLAVAGHDHQVAAFVSGATEPGFLFESLGTADALALTVPAPVAVADVLAVAEAGATIGRTVVADRLMVMAGLRTGQILERIGRLLGVEDRTARRRLSERAASREPDPTLAVDLADGLVSITGIGDDTDAADLWAAAVAATDQRTLDLVDAYARRFGPARRRGGGGWLAQRSDHRRRRAPALPVGGAQPLRRAGCGRRGVRRRDQRRGARRRRRDVHSRRTDMTERSVPVLEGRGLVKTFGTVNALQGADFIVDAGTVTALIGDNGAGKSTLVKVLSGVHPPDGGTILLDGEPVSFRSPLDAHRLGIETVYQDLALAPHLDAAANVFLGREIRRARVFTNKRAMRRRTMAAFRDLEVTTVQDLAVPVALLSGGQRQSVAIARSALWAKRVIFFDEPTAALGVVQTRRVLDLIRRVRDQGLGVVLITHTLPDALEVADRVEVLRFGRRSAHFERADATIELLVAAITGAYSNVTIPEVNGR